MGIFGDKNMKIYYFRYKNFSEKLASGFISFLSNLAIPIVSFYAIIFLLGLFGLLKHTPLEFSFVLFSLSIVIGVICAIRYCVCFKGVTLYDSYMEITTQNLGFGKESPKIKIKYSDIASVFNSTYNLRYDRRKARKTFIAGDLSDYVELTLKGGKQFCFSVYDQTEFLDELLKRREMVDKQ